MPRVPHVSSPQKVLNVLKRKAMMVLKATSVSMLAEPWSNCRHADT